MQGEAAYLVVWIWILDDDSVTGSEESMLTEELSEKMMLQEIKSTTKLETDENSILGTVAYEADIPKKERKKNVQRFLE